MDELEVIINKTLKPPEALFTTIISELIEKIEALVKEADHELHYIYSKFSPLA